MLRDSRSDEHPSHDEATNHRPRSPKFVLRTPQGTEPIDTMDCAWLRWACFRRRWRDGTRGLNEKRCRHQRRGGEASCRGVHRKTPPSHAPLPIWGAIISGAPRDSLDGQNCGGADYTSLRWRIRQLNATLVATAGTHCRCLGILPLVRTVPSGGAMEIHKGAVCLAG